MRFIIEKIFYAFFAKQKNIRIYNLTGRKIEVLFSVKNTDCRE